MSGIHKNTARLSNSNHPTDGYLQRNTQKLNSSLLFLLFYQHHLFSENSFSGFLWFYTITEQEINKSELNYCRTELSFPITELGINKTELNYYRTELGFPITELGINKTELNYYRTELSFPITELGINKTELNYCRTELGFYKTELNYCRTELGYPKTELTLNKYELGWLSTVLHYCFLVPNLIRFYIQQLQKLFRNIFLCIVIHFFYQKNNQEEGVTFVH